MSRFEFRAPILLFLLLLVGAVSCQGTEERWAKGPAHGVATFGAGCFWCSEAVFEQLEGVLDVRAGFMGGAIVEDPTPDALIAAGHAEVVRIEYDLGRITYEELLDWFWRSHDPTSLNRQGEDEGPEYRSVVFLHGHRQRQEFQASLARAQAQFERPIVTLSEDAGLFYEAPDRHQDYYARHRDEPYCQEVIAPHLRSAGLED